MNKVPYSRVMQFAREAEELQNRLNMLQREAHKDGILLVMDVDEADGQIPTIFVSTQINPARIEMPPLACTEPAAATPAKSSRAYIGQPSEAKSE